jgi:uncharacterized protein YlxW (UPF0749 family)
MIVAVLALLIPIVAITGGIYLEVQKTKSKSAAALRDATAHLDDALAEAEAERDRLRQRIEALEAIVTSEGYDLEREARTAGIDRIDVDLLDIPAPSDARERTGRRVRE